MDKELYADSRRDPFTPREGNIPAGDSELYYREVGEGRPIIVLHGATAAFDHKYLLPKMDQLSSSFRLVYYDQRGRGKSAGHVESQMIGIESEVEDLDCVRRYFQFDSLALLGHSWGGLLAMEYAIHHPDRVSHIILMNTAPASHDDWLLTEENFADTKEIEDSPKYKEHDPDAVAERERVFFRPALRRPEDLESLLENMLSGLTRERILQADKIGDRLWAETYLSSGYDLLPKLRQLSIPALIIHGDYDFVPLACVTRIAEAIPGARLVVLKETGHFAYIESMDEVRNEMVNFFRTP